MDNNRLYVVYGDNPREMCRLLLPQTGLAESIDPGKTVLIKPNLVVAKPSSSGATTDPELVGAVIEYLQDNGIKNITIAESAWVGESTAKAFRVCGYEDISRRYGVSLVDLKKDRTVTLRSGHYEIAVAETVLNAGYLVNMPVLKAHCQTKLTCALKNLKGCIPDGEKRRFHTLGLHEPIARLNMLLKTHFIIVDGIAGDLTFEEGGNPVEMNRIIAGYDPVLVDAYTARLIGYEPEEIPYIGLAEKFGVGSVGAGRAAITELNKAEKIAAKFTVPPKIKHLARLVEEKNACSACYGSLLHALARLDEKGKLRDAHRKILIGQGYRGISTGGIGVGTCTAKCGCSLPGCPPSAREMVKFLEKHYCR